MDASALLTKHGWRGAGHGLGSTGHGIARPLLVSNKQDVLGVGKKKIEVADQWWMRAYDTGLKELGSGKQTALSAIRKNGVNKGGLYGFFVRGEGLAGTLSDNTIVSETCSSSASAPSDCSTPATTPEAAPNPEPSKSEKKRKRAEGAENRRKKTKEGSVAQSKGKDRASTKGSLKQEAGPGAATEDPKLLRRAAKKALRLKRARKEADSKQPSEDEATRAGKEALAGPAGEPTEASTEKKKRTRECKSAGSKGEAESAGQSSGGISDAKLKKYAVKAAEKGITVEAFLAKRERKKAKK